MEENGFCKYELEDMEKSWKQTEHEKTVITGLWVTDRPDVIPQDIKDKYFWQITKDLLK